jgi:hypothetical protein
MVSQVWNALLSWASEGGPERQEVLELISTEQRKTFLFWPGGEETSATGEVQPDGHPVLQARSFQSKKIISTLASGELFDSTLSLDQRWRRRWSASSILGALPGTNSLF